MLKKIIIIALVVLLIGGFIYLQNNLLTESHYEIKSERIAGDVSIVHLSDLHTESFGRGNHYLIDRIAAISPDLIAITGDLVDKSTDEQTAYTYSFELAKALTAIAPVYFVSGNHENVSLMPTVSLALSSAGATVIDNTFTDITIRNNEIRLAGIADYNFFNDWVSGDYATALRFSEMLDTLAKSDKYTVLLSHEPQLFDLYSQHGFEVVLCGHAHGGQIRLPFLGGLAAPGQGLFPKYDSGEFVLGKTTMIVSRGLGNSVFPLRLFNYPELNIIKLVNKPA